MAPFIAHSSPDSIYVGYVIAIREVHTSDIRALAFLTSKASSYLLHACIRNLGPEEIRLGFPCCGVLRELRLNLHSFSIRLIFRFS